MKPARAMIFGVLGASAITAMEAALRLTGLPINLELILGSAVLSSVGPSAFVLGLAMHLVLGALFGLLYGFLFERVWLHGGAATGMLLAVLHAALIGMAVGLAPQVHPIIPDVIPDPGPFFANFGVLGVAAFFLIHTVYGAIVGAGYGHVAAEREWAPSGRL